MQHHRYQDGIRGEDAYCVFQGQDMQGVHECGELKGTVMSARSMEVKAQIMSEARRPS